MKPEPKKQGRGIHQILMFQLDCLKAQKFLLFIVKLFLKIQFLLK